jgi:hypothetical protein
MKKNKQGLQAIFNNVLELVSANDCKSNQLFFHSPEEPEK